MKATVFVLIATLLPLYASAQSWGDLKDRATSEAVKSASDSLSGSMTDVVQKKLDITKDQADGGIGSMLSLANERLNPGDYSKLAGMIPGASKYVDTAKKLGALAGPLKNLADLNTALKSLGIAPDVVSKFVPTVTNYLGTLGGGDTAKLLQTAFGS